MALSRYISTNNHKPVSTATAGYWDPSQPYDAKGAAGKVICGSGRYSFFTSASPEIGPLTNLGSALPNDGKRRVFRVDHNNDDAIAIVSLKSGNLPPGHCGVETCASENGEIVVFMYELTGAGDSWFAGGAAGSYQIVGKNMTTGDCWLISHVSGSPSQGQNRSPQISGDGLWVTWGSDSSNVADVALSGDLVMRDILATGSTILVTRATGGGKQTQIRQTLGGPMDYSGRYVFFDSDARDLANTDVAIPNDSNRTVQIWRFDRTTLQRKLITKNADGTPWLNDPTVDKVGSHHQQVTADGDLVVFTSYCTRAENAAKPGFGCIWGIRVSRNEIFPVSVNNSGVFGNQEQADPHVSPCGTFAAWEDGSANMGPGGTQDTYSGIMYSYRRNLRTGLTENLHRLADGSLPVMTGWCHNDVGTAYASLTPANLNATSPVALCPAHPGNRMNGIRFGGSPRLARGGRCVVNNDMGPDGVYSILCIEAA